ncbi:F0F1 ATP synthase subunit delta [Brachybacterium sp. JHP9]|uniref:ATP synthase subunit delta n=1 Tax=Brachybacterium equifaecis TaxID=2910770 RepID=A0ABT0R4C3_9MICO|nr:F0F1 ATP synthase subunit delta [Brachybacterium equifaecis]MCL6423775.1 F0F1 ATP synthase subunit delta [Brachybacterium equifaecis]
MRGTSSTSLTEASRRAGELFRQDGGDLGRTADELFSVADAIDSSNQLVRALSDAGRPAEEKEAVVRSLFDGRISPAALELTLEVVRRRWSEQDDVLDALEFLGIEALLEQADRDGTLGAVEEQLFQVSRAIDDSSALSGALVDARDDSERRAGIMSRLLEGRADRTAVLLARRAVGRSTETKPARRLLEFARFASARRQRLLAVVSSAAPLSDQQQARLGAILARVYGREVQMNVEHDPAVIGGLRIQVGDDLFDATVLARLAQARNRLAA